MSKDTLNAIQVVVDFFLVISFHYTNLKSHAVFVTILNKSEGFPIRGNDIEINCPIFRHSAVSQSQRAVIPAWPESFFINILLFFRVAVHEL
jgi:hypothetical protein